MSVIQNHQITKEYLDNLQQELENQGYELAVDCFISNEKGQIFAQKRSMDRRLYPGCWDIPGGHVDPGDSIWNTLFKEIKEELNLEVDKIIRLVDKIQWTVPKESVRSWESANKMILQFQISVKDFENLKLEEGKSDKYLWIDMNNIEILKENRHDEGDYYTYNSVRKFLEG